MNAFNITTQVTDEYLLLIAESSVHGMFVAPSTRMPSLSTPTPWGSNRAKNFQSSNCLRWSDTRQLSVWRRIFAEKLDQPDKNNAN